MSTNGKLLICFSLVLPERELAELSSANTVLPTKNGKTILGLSTDSRSRKLPLVLPSTAHPICRRFHPQSAAEVLALTTTLADFTNTRNTRDVNVEMLAGCEVEGAFSHGTLLWGTRIFWPALENTIVLLRSHQLHTALRKRTASSEP